jgi:hypothetical protein
MAFFARPNLDNTQFKQLKDSELTLSGQTQIATTSGLTLVGDAGTGPAAYGGMWIPIIATGASNNFVLTYDGTDKVIKLKASTASGGSTVYTESGATTCTVGGLSAGTTIYNCTLDCVLQCILNPTVYPALSSPSLSSFTITPSTTLYEVGAVSNVCGTACFNAGCINPQYTALCDKRSCGTLCYVYNAFGVPYECITNAPSVPNYSFGANVIGAGSNYVSASICYCSGVQPYDSSGAAYNSPLSTGVTSVCTRTITGVYPWYWGTLTCAAAAGVGRPTACCIKDGITGGTLTNGTCNKCVGTSTGTLDVVFGSTSSDYLWFATPVGSTTKTCWYETALNNGCIGGGVSVGCNLFPAPDTVTGMDSFESCWCGQSYKIYVSNYQSASVTNMELRNS